MCTDSGSSIGPHCQKQNPPLAPFHQLYIYMVGKKHSGKVDQLTLASEGSEQVQLFSVAISWDDKMNFSLCANLAGFCSNSQISVPYHMHTWLSSAIYNYSSQLHLHYYNNTVATCVIRQNCIFSILICSTYFIIIQLVYNYTASYTCQTLRHSIHAHMQIYNYFKCNGNMQLSGQLHM